MKKTHVTLMKNKFVQNNWAFPNIEFNFNSFYTPKFLKFFFIFVYYLNAIFLIFIFILVGTIYAKNCNTNGCKHYSLWLRGRAKFRFFD